MRGPGARQLATHDAGATQQEAPPAHDREIGSSLAGSRQRGSGYRRPDRPANGTPTDLETSPFTRRHERHQPIAGSLQVQEHSPISLARIGRAEPLSAPVESRLELLWPVRVAIVLVGEPQMVEATGRHRRPCPRHPAPARISCDLEGRAHAPPARGDSKGEAVQGRHEGRRDRSERGWRGGGRERQRVTRGEGRRRPWCGCRRSPSRSGRLAPRQPDRHDQRAGRESHESRQRVGRQADPAELGVAIRGDTLHTR